MGKNKWLLLVVAVVSLLFASLGASIVMADDGDPASYVQENYCTYTDDKGAKQEAELAVEWYPQGTRTNFELIMKENDEDDLVTASRDFGMKCTVVLSETMPVKIWARTASVIKVDDKVVKGRANGMKQTGKMFYFELKPMNDSNGLKLAFSVDGLDVGSSGEQLPSKDTDLARLSRGMPLAAYGIAYVSADDVEDFDTRFGKYPFFTVDKLGSGAQIITYPLFVDRYMDHQDAVAVRVWMGFDGNPIKTLNKLYGGLVVVQLQSPVTVNVNAVEAKPLYFREDGEWKNLRKGINNFRRPSVSEVIALFPAAYDEEGSNGLELIYNVAATDLKGMGTQKDTASAGLMGKDGEFSPLDKTLMSLLGGKKVVEDTTPNKSGDSSTTSPAPAPKADTMKPAKPALPPAQPPAAPYLGGGSCTGADGVQIDMQVDTNYQSSGLYRWYFTKAQTNQLVAQAKVGSVSCNFLASVAIHVDDTADSRVNAVGSKYLEANHAYNRVYLQGYSNPGFAVDQLGR